MLPKKQDESNHCIKCSFFYVHSLLKKKTISECLVPSSAPSCQSLSPFCHLNFVLHNQSLWKAAMEQCYHRHSEIAELCNNSNIATTNNNSALGQQNATWGPEDGEI